MVDGTRLRACRLSRLRRLPTKRWRQLRQHLRIQAATQAHQRPGLTHVDDVDDDPFEGIRQGAQCELHGSKAAAQPTYSRWQRQRQVTYRPGRRLDAARACDDSDNLLDLGKQARQACGHEVRQQAEGAVSLRAIPTSHTKTLRSNPRVAAMARETAATAEMQRAHGQRRVAPLCGRDVSIDA